MHTLQNARQSAFFTIFLIIASFVTVNCQVLVIPDSDIGIINVNRMMEVLQKLRQMNIFEILQRSREENFSINRATSMNDTECNRQIANYYTGINNMEMWALKMWDASSKIPSGIFMGNFKDIGMYDECSSIRIMKDNMTVTGQHCMYTLSTKIPQSVIPINTMLSICLPAACRTNEVKYLLQSVLNITKQYVNGSDLIVTSVNCTNVDAEPWDTGAIIVIVIIGLLVSFLMICTILSCLVNFNVFSRRNKPLLSALCEFSFLTNGKRILSTTAPRSNIPAIAGLRFFSMCWIILGHTYVVQIIGVLINVADLIAWSSSWNALSVFIAPFAVDTFFLMSGFLTSYLFFKEMKSEYHKFNPIIYYTHRYVRLTPAMGVLLLLTIFILPRVGSGALWQINMNSQKSSCLKHWWNFLLYIQNYRGTEVMACLGHTWYLAVDMQLFWISPLILYPLSRKPKMGMFILGIFFIVSIMTPTVIALKNEYSGGTMGFKNLAHMVDLMSDYYIPSYTRATPWLVGVFMGYKLSSPTTLSDNSIRLGWILSMSALAFIFFSYRVFQNEKYEFNLYWEGFYAGFSRTIWSSSICWIIYASTLGYGGFIGNFLSLPIFLPFSRISYSIYLVHFSIQMMKVSATRIQRYFSDFEMIDIFFSDFLMCIFVGFLFSLLFESPFLVLEKLVLVKLKEKKSTNLKEEL